MTSLKEQELVSIIEQEVANAIGNFTGDLANARAEEIRYYNCKPFGNEMEGESQVISSDVFDTVEGMLPDLIKKFAASDEAVRFDPYGPEDEEQAIQRTETVNHVFYKQNNGFLIIYEWFKDALINKNGIVQYWWEEKIEEVEEEYEGLTEGQYLKLIQDKDTEVLSHKTRPDEAATEQRDRALEDALNKVPPGPQSDILKAQIQQRAELIQIPNLHDVKLKIKKNRSKVCIETIPPENFRISQKTKCVSIQDTLFCSHEEIKTVSQLRAEGCPQKVIDEAGWIGDTYDQETNIDALARDRFLDERPVPMPEPDPSLREISVSDCFMRVDWDGDGIAELRHIIKVGRAIWVNEGADHIYFAALTPVIMPHRWVGMSVAEMVMADQFTKSVILRQMLNNLYLVNNPRKAVLANASGQVMANLDDLMDSRAGGIMREYVQGAIRNEETPFVAAAAFPVLEYIDHQKELRTGQTRYSQGTDADSLNKTARGIQLIQQAGQQRLDLIARIFAETGVKDLMRGIAYTLSKYSDKSISLKLRNKWVEIDPREWKEQFDMTVNVGLGTGNKDVELAHLDMISKAQIELMQEGRGYMVTDENIYNVYKRKAQAMGYKHPEMFVADPQTVQKPPPQPNPDLIKIQQAAQETQQKIQSNEKIRMFDAQTQKEVETIKGQTQIAIARENAAANERIEAMRQQHEARLKIYESNQPEDERKLQYQKEIAAFQEQANAAVEAERIASNERIAVMNKNFEEWKTLKDNETKIEVAEIAANSHLKVAKLKPKPQPTA